MVDIIDALHPFSALDKSPKITLLSNMSKLGALIVQDLWTEKSEPKDFSEKFSRVQGLSPEMVDLTQQLISSI